MWFWFAFSSVSARGRGGRACSVVPRGLRRRRFFVVSGRLVVGGGLRWLRRCRSSVGLVFRVRRCVGWRLVGSSFRCRAGRAVGWCRPVGSFVVRRRSFRLVGRRSRLTRRLFLAAECRGWVGGVSPAPLAGVGARPCGHRQGTGGLVLNQAWFTLIKQVLTLVL